MASNEKLTLIKTKCENETENIFYVVFKNLDKFLHLLYPYSKS